MADQMRYEQQPGPPYPARLDVGRIESPKIDQPRTERSRPGIAEGWPAPPGGWPDSQWMTTPYSDSGGTSYSDDGYAASTKPEPQAWMTPAVAEPPSGGPPPGHPPGPTPPHHAALPESGRPKHLGLILSIIAGVVVVGVIGAATTAAIFASRSYRAAQKQATVGMDTPVRDGAFQFTVDGMRCGIREIGTPDDYTAPTGQFCAVTMSVANVGKSPAVFADALQKAYGPNGVSFISDSEAGLYANPNPDVFLNDINPGNRVRVVVVYDIPASGRILKLEVHENPDTKGAIIKTS